MANITLNRLIQHIKSHNEDGYYDVLISQIDHWIIATKENKIVSTKSKKKTKENNSTTNEISKEKIQVMNLFDEPQGDFINIDVVNRIANNFANKTRETIARIDKELNELESPTSKYEYTSKKLEESHYLHGQLSGIYGLLDDICAEFHIDKD